MHCIFRHFSFKHTLLILLQGDFAISNPYVGVISVAKPLNAEQTSTYNLTVMAKDDGSLNHRKSLNSTVSIFHAQFYS